MTDHAAHSRYGGSVIDRVINCAGSVALCATVPKGPSSGFADEGSAAHELAERCLKEDVHPTHFLGEAFEKYPGHPVTREMCGAVVIYLNAVTHEMALTKDAELYVEKGFVLDIPSAEPGEVFGRNDAMVYHPSTGRMRVFDYKHGAGVSVSVEDSPQLKFYAAGAAFSNPWKIKEVILTIVQPRDRNEEVPAVRDWAFDVADLFEFMSEVDEAIAKAKSCEIDVVSALFYDGDAQLLDHALFNTGNHCRWCDAAAICPAREREALEAAQVTFQDITVITAADLPEPASLNAERLAKVVAGIDILNGWANQVREFLESQMLNAGLKVPGWKVVDKIGRAKWVSDEESVEQDLAMLYDINGELIRPRKLTTIGDVEKLMKAAGATKEQIDDFKLRHTLKESSGCTIAPESDRRPAVDAVQRAFGDVQV